MFGLPGGAAALTIGLYHPRAYYGDGGITRSVRSLSHWLRHLGHDNRVIFHGPASTQDPSWMGVDHLDLGPLSLPRGLAKALTDIDVVVLHSAWVPYNVVAANAARRGGIPYVLAPRGAYEPRILERRPLAKSAWWRLFERRLVAQAAAIHVFFESQSDHIRRLGYEGPLVVAPNGVEVPADLVWHGQGSDSVAFVGRFDMEHKGLDVLLAGLRRIPESGRPRLVLRGPDWRGGKDRTRAAVDRLSLGRWVEVGPPIYGRAKFELMAASRGFVYPSNFEAFGNSAAEAAALGVPLLTGRYPLGEYLAARGGALSVPGDPDAMAVALEHLVGSSASEMGGRARSAMVPFSWEAVADAWANQLLSLESVGG